MSETGRGQSKSRPAGYAALIARYGVDVIPNWHASRVATRGIHRTGARDGIAEEIFPPRYWPGDTLGDHLEFALKHDGTNLAILASLFREMPEDDFLAYLRSRPTGKYARRLWFLYEFLTDRTLPLDDLKQGNYVDLLEPDAYYTVEVPRRIRRQRVNDNLPGDRRFCPTIRRTGILRDFEAADLSSRCRRVASRYAPALLKRALGYLYARETKSSFEIEHITPTSTRTERFVALLRLAQREDFCSRRQLIELQNRIVDARFRDVDYRRTQNYVGETVAWRNERVHFASPKPEDLGSLMEGLTAAHERMTAGNAHAVIHAAAIVRIRLSPPFRGRQRPHPPVPDSQHPRPPRLHSARDPGARLGDHAEEPRGL